MTAPSTEAIILAWLGISLACACVCAFLAHEKRRNATGWGVLGFLLGVLAILAVGFAPSLDA